MSKNNGLPWFKCFQDAWLEGTRDLTPDQRGIYFDCLCLIYKYDAPIRNDDEWIAYQLHVSTRKWRTVCAALIAAGKLTKTKAGLINSRASAEVAERSSIRSKLSEAATIRERFARGSSASQPRVEREPTPKILNFPMKTTKRKHGRGQI